LATPKWFGRTNFGSKSDQTASYSTSPTLGSNQERAISSVGGTSGSAKPVWFGRTSSMAVSASLYPHARRQCEDALEQKFGAKPNFYLC